ncbi:nudix hydrolase [Dickeya phage vB_DsoM_JA29]|uniref:Putative NUDIX hydrolase n=1 Tax=Dickeya phage vB_DsoM_JA29 TaxID=2283031 RepID=A0A384ZX81_9CAUD|nr:nudix hydrolase [Dickeya phage vB_DsoM_JA29]AXG66837.1 putative NUDIX hydrolase [Dickeya phage vB_DsoM_JA29]
MKVILTLDEGDGRKPRKQSGVIPYRYNDEGDLEICMIRTKHANNWGLPKGGKEPDLSLEASAIKEAMEEAGLRGVPGKKIAKMEYVKGSTGRLQKVTWFLMQVHEELDNYLEVHQRERRWFSAEDALKKIDRDWKPVLKQAIKKLELGAS